MIVIGGTEHAKTDEMVLPDNEYHMYHMGGNHISVKTLDLDCDFAIIRKQLDDIAQRLGAEEIKQYERAR